MTSEQKKVLLLIKAVIFNYHGLDEEEKKILEQTAKEIDGYEELKWVNDFIAQDDFSSFERSRGFFNSVVQNLDNQTKLSFLVQAWDANLAKGYVSEIEATSLLKLAKDWNIQSDFISFVRSRRQS
jgi:hypothetical protein